MSPVANGLLVVLFIMTTAALFVGALKGLQLTRFVRAQRRFLERADKAESAEALVQLSSSADDPGASVLQQLVRRLARGNVGPEELRGVAQQAIAVQQRRAASLTSVLTAVAATGPLLGLFGTVWGIIEAFMAVDTVKSSALSVIAPPMAGALLTTAFGLMGAIPAILAMQFAERQIDELVDDLEASSQTWIGLLLGR